MIIEFEECKIRAGSKSEASLLKMKGHLNHSESKQYLVVGCDEGTEWVKIYDIAEDGYISVICGIGIHEGYLVHAQDVMLTNCQWELEIGKKHTSLAGRRQMKCAVDMLKNSTIKHYTHCTPVCNNVSGETNICQDCGTHFSEADIQRSVRDLSKSLLKA